MANSRRDSPEPEVGMMLGPYRLDAVAGEGAMGRVFRAVHTKIGRTVALKVLRRRYAESAETVARFFQEARAVNVIHHPNIVEATDFIEAGTGSDDNYYIMEWLEGETLAARLAREGTLPWLEVVRIGRQLALALGAAHRSGFVHRDLKPDNFFLIRGTQDADDPRPLVKILDFGVAGLRGESDGAVVGAAAYLSPEVAAGQAVDGRSDIYSLGVVLYELCAGAPPLRAESFSEYVMKHMTKRPRPLSDAVPLPIPAPLADAVDRCLEKKPASRFQTMEDLAAALAVVDEEDEFPLDEPRRLLRIGAVAAVLVATLAFIGIRAWFHSDATGVNVAAQAPPKPSVEKMAPAAAVAPAPPTVAVDERVAVSVRSEPRGAEVFHDGAVMGVTPCTVRLLPGRQQLELRRDGFVPRTLTVDVAPDAQLSAALEATRIKHTKPTMPTKRSHGAAKRNATIDPFR